MTDEIIDPTEQLPLFPAKEQPAAVSEAQPAPAPQTTLSPRSAFPRALGEFDKYMQERGFTENTQLAFQFDMQILAEEYLTPATTLGDISTATLNAFLKWMEHEREAPCSPKTLERRITTLKVFFGWLAEIGALPRDVAAPLLHHAVTAPLPDMLSEADIAALLDITRMLRHGSGEQEPDARPHLLFTLILHTGIKKSECVGIHLNHLDLTDLEHPALWIRYQQARRRHKERRIDLPPTWPAILREYLAQYPSRQFLFPWSARNLEYVLTGVAKQADVPRLSFEMLRWTCAVRDFRAEMDREALRRKLGLSEISWYEVEPKLALLAQIRQAKDT